MVKKSQNQSKHQFWKLAAILVAILFISGATFYFSDAAGIIAIDEIPDRVINWALGFVGIFIADPWPHSIAPIGPADPITPIFTPTPAPAPIFVLAPAPAPAPLLPTPVAIIQPLNPIPPVPLLAVRPPDPLPVAPLTPPVAPVVDLPAVPVIEENIPIAPVRVLRRDGPRHIEIPPTPLPIPFSTPTPEPTPTPTPAPTPTPTPTHVRINEIQVAGETANDEFIELYNSKDYKVDLSEWSIQYRGSGAKSFLKKNFELRASIPARGYFLIARSDSTFFSRADMTHKSFSLSARGGTIFLVSDTEHLITGDEQSIVDKVAYGTGSYLFPEGSPVPVPEINTSIQRKKLSDGTFQDTNNNADDFEILTIPTPRNAASGPETASVLATNDRKNADDVNADNSENDNSGNDNGDARESIELQVDQEIEHNNKSKSEN